MRRDSSKKMQPRHEEQSTAEVDDLMSEVSLPEIDYGARGQLE